MAHLAREAGPFRFTAPVALAERPRGLALAAHQASMLFRWGLRGTPLLVAKHQSRAMGAAVRRAVAEFRPDAALVELAQTAQYLPCLDGVPTVLTDHEGGIPANATTDLGGWADRRDVRLWRAYVAAYYPRADLVQAVTDEDGAQLRAMLGRPVATRLPVVRMPSHPAAKTRTPPRALFLGNYRHRPNPEAAEVLARDVLPRLRERMPDAELWLAGPHPERLPSIGHLPGVRVVGFVEDLAGLFAQVRLLLAPLFSGGGFRMKALSAMAHGVPVVTNALGARGFAVPEPARTVAEGTDALVQAALALLEDPRHAAAAGKAAHRWAAANLSPEAVAATQLERIQTLLVAR
ncbi:MAG: glycosyltransferase [Planctomycetota bacterium]